MCGTRWDAYKGAEGPGHFHYESIVCHLWKFMATGHVLSECKKTNITPTLKKEKKNLDRVVNLPSVSAKVMVQNFPDTFPNHKKQMIATTQVNYSLSCIRRDIATSLKRFFLAISDIIYLFPFTCEATTG